MWFSFHNLSSVVFCDSNQRVKNSLILALLLSSPTPLPHLLLPVSVLLPIFFTWFIIDIILVNWFPRLSPHNALSWKLLGPSYLCVNSSLCFMDQQPSLLFYATFYLPSCAVKAGLWSQLINEKTRVIKHSWG